MISNQILQSTIDGLKGITRIDISVMDTDGKVLASTADNLSNMRILFYHLLRHLLIVRLFRVISFLRCLMSINLNMLLWQRVTVKMYL